jgi:hypothetical protein
VQYVHYLTTQEDAGWGETVAGWITEDRERIDYFEINSWFHDRGHEVRAALIEAGHIEDGSGFFVERSRSPEIQWWTIFMYRCPPHLLNTCG